MAGRVFLLVERQREYVMQIDKKEFFRKATLMICGSLDVETFLYRSFLYIRKYVPADRVFLTYTDSERGRLIALARATKQGGEFLDLSVALPSNIKSFVKRPDIETLVVERAEEHPTARPWIAHNLLARDSSLLILRLILESTIIGGLIFTCEAGKAFSREHADLVSLLREPFAIALSNCVRYQKLMGLKDRLAEDNQFLHNELRLTSGDKIIGADFGLSDVMEMVRKVAPLSSPVLLLGETGTGKEVVANAIHTLSARSHAPFIKVNCGAIPESLMDSELFGHEKGAFTGALSLRRGRFERGDRGTVFLDEVAELRPEAQVRLLRVLQDKEIERVGGTESVKVDIRIIAATNRDLESMIHDGSFREDLYFRLNVFPITIPPLRKRREDIPSLVYYFLQKKSLEMGLKDIPSPPPETIEMLKRYAWPGNVRELENAVERALILGRGGFPDFADILALINDSRLGKEKVREAQVDLHSKAPLALDEVMADQIRRVLEMTNGRVGGKGGAADLLKVNPSTLRKRMRKLGIVFGRKSKNMQTSSPKG